MDIDMGALRALEREREISLPVLLDAIRSALHAAYLHTDHPVRDSEVLIDERTGEVAVAEGLDAPVGAVLQVTTYGPDGTERPSSVTVVGLVDLGAELAGGASRAFVEPVLQRLRELSTPGLLLSGDPAEGVTPGRAGW